VVIDLRYPKSRHGRFWLTSRRVGATISAHPVDSVDVSLKEMDNDLHGDERAR
jgi:hypothetical protein